MSEPKTVPYECAFPTGHIGDPGCTKREYFAALAMQGMMANGEWDKNSKESVAQHAVFYADALIEALNKQP